MPEQVKTQVPGNVWKVLVSPGDVVKEGDILFVLEVMKTEFAHYASTQGIVTTVLIFEGQEAVDADVLAIEIG